MAQKSAGGTPAVNRKRGGKGGFGNNGGSKRGKSGNK
jgi:hypothetical protein